MPNNEVKVEKTARSEESIKNTEFCDKAGKLAGKVTKRLYIIQKQIEKQLSKLGNSSSRFARKALGQFENSWKLLRQEQKLGECHTELGAEISRLLKQSDKDIFSQPKVKALIKQIREIEDAIQKIKKSVETKKTSRAKPARLRAKKANPPLSQPGGASNAASEQV
ncbi:MAG: hypothetical protein HY811_01555 [Planctomycetes bacterium]|nr:hypothetical protein [Planctomycetota bacterium]